MCTDYFFDILTGLPDGVVNMVFGTGKNAGAAIVEHPKINLLSFTGSTAVGKYIQEKSAQHIKKLSLEVHFAVHAVHAFTNDVLHIQNKPLYCL